MAIDGHFNPPDTFAGLRRWPQPAEPRCRLRLIDQAQGAGAGKQWAAPPHARQETYNPHTELALELPRRAHKTLQLFARKSGNQSERRTGDSSEQQN
jgi:hypothetical protein